MIQQAVRWSPQGCGRFGATGFQCPSGLPAWNDVCARAFDRFPRLDPLSKLVNLLAEWLLEAASPDLGLVLASRYGCVEADLAYYRTAANTPELASPQLFPYTLPSAGVAEVAIRHQLHGPSAVLLQDDGLSSALGLAQRWLETGAAPQCLVMHADALLAAGAQFLQVRPRIEGWAFLLGLDGGWVLPADHPGNIKPGELYAVLEKQIK